MIIKIDTNSPDFEYELNVLYRIAREFMPNAQGRKQEPVAESPATETTPAAVPPVEEPAPATKAPAKTRAKAKPAADTPVEYTQDEARQRVAKHTRIHGTASLKAALDAVGYAKLSEVPTEKLGALLEHMGVA